MIYNLLCFLKVRFFRLRQRACNNITIALPLYAGVYNNNNNNISTLHANNDIMTIILDIGFRLVDGTGWLGNVNATNVLCIISSKTIRAQKNTPSSECRKRDNSITCVIFLKYLLILVKTKF